MKKAIDFLQSIGIKCDNSGNILSGLPDGSDGIELIDKIEDATMQDDNCFTIIGDRLEKIDL